MRFAPLALLAFIALAPDARAQYATDERVGTITATAASANSSTIAAVVAGFEPGASYFVQCDVSAYFEQVATSVATTSSTTGILLNAGEKWPFRAGSYYRFAAVIANPSSGTAVCKVWRSW